MPGARRQLIIEAGRQGSSAGTCGPARRAAWTHGITFARVARKCAFQGADRPVDDAFESGIPQPGLEPLPDPLLMDNRHYPSVMRLSIGRRHELRILRLLM